MCVCDLYSYTPYVSEFHASLHLAQLATRSRPASACLITIALSSVLLKRLLVTSCYLFITKNFVLFYS